jgi:hypothetical protein
MEEIRDLGDADSRVAEVLDSELTPDVVDWS